MDKDFLKTLVVTFKEREDTVKKHFSIPKIVSSGTAAKSLMSQLSFFAIANYVLERDVEGLRSKLKEIVNLQIDLMKRFAKGEPISKSYVTLLNYQQLYDALASGDMELAEMFAKMLIGKEEIEEIHIFVHIMGICLRSLVLNDEKMFLEWNVKQFERCYEKDKSFAGYPKVMKGIFQKDEAKVNEGLKDLLKGHRKLIVGAGVFNNTDQKWLCVWGLGLANLAISRGIRVDIDDEYLPRDLLMQK